MNTVSIILNLINEKQITEQKFLADLGFNRTLLSDWKSGKSKSYSRHINKIAEYFDVSTDYLLGNTDIKNPTTYKGREVTEREQKYLDKIDLMTPEQLRLLEIFIDGLEKNNQ